MKNMNKLSFLSFALLLVSAQTLFAHCRDCSRNSVVLWTSVGYSNIMNHSPFTRVLGGLGNAIGIGYEHTASRGFLLQTGIELSLYNSLMHRSDTLHIVPMIDTQLRPFDGLFSFENINSRQQIANVGPTLMIGARTANNFYFLIGGKVKFNIHGRERTNTDVTKRGFFPDLIGDDHDGILSNMPSHGFDTFSRLHESSFRLNPLFIGSFEAGYDFSSGNFRASRNSRNMRMRLAVFCDYGFSRVSESHNDLIINKALREREFIPYINGFLQHDVSSNFFNTLFTGVRLTILFNLPGRYECRWQM